MFYLVLVFGRMFSTMFVMLSEIGCVMLFEKAFDLLFEKMFGL